MRHKYILLIPLVLFLFNPAKVSGQVNNEFFFNDFIWKFGMDSIFQIERVVFPLIYVTTSPDNEDDFIFLKINKGDYRYDSLCFGNNQTFAYPVFYNNFRGKLRVNNKMVYHWYAIDGGGSRSYFFRNIKGKWYLVKISSPDPWSDEPLEPYTK